MDKDQLIHRYNIYIHERVKDLINLIINLIYIKYLNTFLVSN